MYLMCRYIPVFYYSKPLLKILLNFFGNLKLFSTFAPYARKIGNKKRRLGKILPNKNNLTNINNSL